MRWLKTLSNPFVLGLYGFAAGAALFFATHDEARDPRAQDARQADRAEARPAA